MKRPFLLLEVLISLTIISAILISLFHFFTHIHVIKKNVEDAKEIVFERAHIQQRLTHIFSHLCPPVPLEIAFHGNAKHLYFLFDNGIDPDPSFSGIVQGELFLNAEEKTIHLRFKPFPEKKKSPSREEILGTSIQNFALSFFRKEKNKWDISWKEYSLPPMIKLSVTKSNVEEVSFCFFTLSEHNIVEY
ncbi:MAG: DUF1494 domain-containing protein [Chlamydiota bacterium]